MSIARDIADDINVGNVGLPLKDSNNADVLAEDINGVVTLTADEANVGSNALVVDSSGNVGIGTSSPQYKLHIRGADATSNFVVGSTVEGTQLEVLTYQDNKVVLRSNDNGNGRILAFETGTTQRMQIDSSGNIGAPTGANIYNPSDERLKQNITELSGCLQKVLSMRGVSFNWIDKFCDSEADKTLYGLIAQELQAVDSNLVDSFSDNVITAGDVTVENPLRVNEKFIIPMLVESIKEQQTLIESQQSQIDALTAKTQEQDLTIASLISRIEALESNTTT